MPLANSFGPGLGFWGVRRVTFVDALLGRLACLCLSACCCLAGLANWFALGSGFLGLWLVTFVDALLGRLACLCLLLLVVLSLAPGVGFRRVDGLIAIVDCELLFIFFRIFDCFLSTSPARRAHFVVEFLEGEALRLYGISPAGSVLLKQDVLR